MSDAPSLPEVMRAAVNQAAASLHVSMPGRVVRYDPARQAAAIKPLIRRGVRLQGERVVESLPEIPNVPVVFLGGGGFSVTHPLTAGDTGLLVFADSSLDRWLTRGGEVDPGDDRAHALKDAAFFPGMRDFAHALTSPVLAGNALCLAAPTGGQVKLGGLLALQSALQGENFLVALGTLVTAIATAVGGIPGGAAAGTAIGTALTTFLAAQATYKSLKVKVE